MNDTLSLSAGRSGVRNPGRDKCTPRTIAVDVKVKDPLCQRGFFRRPVFSVGGQRELMSVATVRLLIDLYYRFFFLAVVKEC